MKLSECIKGLKVQVIPNMYLFELYDDSIGEIVGFRYNSVNKNTSGAPFKVPIIKFNNGYKRTFKPNRLKLV